MSNCIPSVNTSSVVIELDSSTVITPLRPIRLTARPISEPIVASCPETVATWAIASSVVDVAGDRLQVLW